MRVIVCGSRGWKDKKIVFRVLDSFPESVFPHTIVHGGAKGADMIADEIARILDYEVEIHKPDYERYSGKTAPLKRNEEMAQLGADKCIAFWDLQSTGTRHMVNEALKHEIPAVVVDPSGDITKVKRMITGRA